jgi:glycolate oxidase
MGYMESIFSETSLNAMCELRSVFDPERRSNPGKVVPIHSCREWQGVPAVRRAEKQPTPLEAEPSRPVA